MSRALIQAASGHYSFVRVAEVLREAGIECMPIKGVYLMATARRDRPREMSDVDVLVRPADFLSAYEELTGARFETLWFDRDDQACALRGPVPSVVDLHGRLFHSGLFRLNVDELFDRCALDTGLFGVEVRVPSWLDVYAITVGHAAKDRRRSDDEQVVSDLEALAGLVDSRAVAQHLSEHGLGRAARYVLRHIAQDQLALEVVGALPPDRVGDCLAEALARWVERLPRRHIATAVAPHLLNESAIAGLKSFAIHALTGLRQRVLETGCVSRRPSPWRART